MSASWNPATYLRTGCLAALVAVGATALLAAPTVVHAQDATASDVDGGAKAGPDGMLGLGLIGAEIGMVVPALLGVNETWPYLVFPAVGAIGGGVAGIFLLQDGSFSPAAGQGSPEISVIAFAVGLVGLIPSLVAVMSATAYDPENEVGSAQSNRIADRMASRLPGGELGSGLLRVGDDEAVVGVPGISVSQRAADMRRMLEARSEVSVSVLSGRF